MYRRVYVKEGDGVKRNSGVILVLFGVLFVVVVGLVGLFLLGASKRNDEMHVDLGIEKVVLEEVSVIPSLSVVPSMMGLDRGLLRVLVLNGSGTVGAGREISEYLSGLGYRVVSVRNADRYDYLNVEVLVNPEKSEYAQLLKMDLEEMGASVAASLSEEIEGDAEVIVGKQ